MDSGVPPPSILIQRPRSRRTCLPPPRRALFRFRSNHSINYDTMISSQEIPPTRQEPPCLYHEHTGTRYYIYCRVSTAHAYLRRTFPPGRNPPTTTNTARAPWAAASQSHRITIHDHPSHRDKESSERDNLASDTPQHDKSPLQYRASKTCTAVRRPSCLGETYNTIPSNASCAENEE